jgi:hypothetical protein
MSERAGGPRPQPGFTSASSHPELVSGDLAVPPRAYASITSMNRSIGVAGSRRAFGMLGVVAVAALLSTMTLKPSAAPDDGELDKQKFARMCMEWHLAAGAAVSRLIQSTRDADLLLVSDSVFRMRRARRNCEAGWITLACQDYHSVTAGTPGYVMTSQTFPCSRIAPTPDPRNEPASSTTIGR